VERWNSGFMVHHSISIQGLKGELSGNQEFDERFKQVGLLPERLTSGHAGGRWL
jgi:hypothetical protein